MYFIPKWHKSYYKWNSSYLHETILVKGAKNFSKYLLNKLLFIKSFVAQLANFLWYSTKQTSKIQNFKSLLSIPIMKFQKNNKKIISILFSSLQNSNFSLGNKKFSIGNKKEKKKNESPNGQEVSLSKSPHVIPDQSASDSNPTIIMLYPP